MDYIVLNGISSDTIRGLMIQSLPPISKAQIRTQLDVIDGRDGDIVTKLGYASYDRDVVIALHGNFDIDRVIAFFNSSGTAIFSNELTKYYKYDIVNQIDFEKLIRYRTATVTFHVQPFKYSAVETATTHRKSRYLSIPPATVVKNGLTLNAGGGNVTISGTAAIQTEIYLPINTLALMPENYTLYALASGSGADAVTVRLIKDAPSVAGSFGGGAVRLEDNDTVTLTAEYTIVKYFNYLYFYVDAGQSIDISLSVILSYTGDLTFTVTNTGNYTALPTLTIYGSGAVGVSVNGNAVLSIAGLAENITIDAEAQEAYKGSLATLKNRLVTGDYTALALAPGVNTISVSGTVTDVKIENYSRWV